MSGGKSCAYFLMRGLQTFIARGYTFVQAEVRGRGRSGGDIATTSASTTELLGYVAGRTLNTDFVSSDYVRKKLLEHHAQQGSFRTLDEALGIPQDDWWMVDGRGHKLSLMKMWLDQVGDETRVTYYMMGREWNGVMP